jgi:hypothetical protein
MTPEIKQLIETIENIESDDNTIDMLKDAAEYYCGNFDICEGYKHAIIMALEDQYQNHAREQESDDTVELKKILGITIELCE